MKGDDVADEKKALLDAFEMNEDDLAKIVGGVGLTPQEGPEGWDSIAKALAAHCVGIHKGCGGTILDTRLLKEVGQKEATSYYCIGCDTHHDLLDEFDYTPVDYLSMIDE